VRFLLLNQFYPPDNAPTGWMLHDLAVALVGRGHEVSVVCSRVGYAGGGDLRTAAPTEGVAVVRVGGAPFPRRWVAGRVAAYLTYLLAAAWASLRGPRPDLIVTMTTPPFLGIVGALSARLRGSRHAQWTMDVYPDALRAHWPALGRPLVWWALTQLGRFQFWGAATVVSPGPCVEERLRRYVPSLVPSSSIPLWGTIAMGEVAPDEVRRERERRGWRPEDLVLMYSGNMGLGHTFTEFLAAARRIGAPDTAWAFVGEGPRRLEVETFASENPGPRIELRPFAEASRLAQSLAAADVHLVSLAPGWDGVMVPSKLQSVFSIGRPVIFVGSVATALGSWIREAGAGWVVPPNDVDALVRAIEEARDPAERARRGAAALSYARRHFDRDRNRAAIADLLEQCVRPSRARGV